MKARVTVTLKPSVLDPQGKAIEGALRGMDFSGVGSVRQGKVFDIELGDTDRATAEAGLKAMSEKLLANTVVENYAIEFIDEKNTALPGSETGEATQTKKPSRSRSKAAAS